VKHRPPLKYYDGKEWRLGVLVSVLADFPGYYAIFLVKDILTKEDHVIHSRNTDFMV
jgi:hypothetical protein